MLMEAPPLVFRRTRGAPFLFVVYLLMAAAAIYRRGVLALAPTCRYPAAWPSRKYVASAAKRAGYTSKSTCLFSTPGHTEILTSTKSSTVKYFKSLANKKRKRMEENATIIEGQRLVFDMLSDRATRHLIKHIMVEETLLCDKDSKMMSLVQSTGILDSNTSSIKVSFGSRDVVNACCDTVTPQGIVAATSLPVPYQGYDNTKPKSHVRLYLVLDGLSDPGNVGTLLRSSLASGVVEAVILLPGSCDVWNPKSVRSAMGASFKIPLLHVKSWAECKEKLHSFGVELENNFYAATMEDSGASSSLPHYDIDFSSERQPSAICIGKEGPGLSAEVRKDVRDGVIRAVHVPMQTGIESLNAAICGSVILFESSRQQNQHHQCPDKGSL